MIVRHERARRVVYCMILMYPRVVVVGRATPALSSQGLGLVALEHNKIRRRDKRDKTGQGCVLSCTTAVVSLEHSEPLYIVISLMILCIT